MTNRSALPPLTPALVDAFAASALDWLGWLMSVMLRLGPARRSRRLKRAVEMLERGVEAIIFLKAVLHIGLPVGQRRAARPLDAPRGFARTRFARRRRLLFKHAHICDRRAGLYARVLRAIAALTRPARYIARFAARLARGLCATTLTPIAPPATALVAAPAQRVPFADTS